MFTFTRIKYFLLFLAILINFDIILCSVSRNKLLNNLENYDDLEKIDCSSSEEVCKKEYSELEEIFSNAKQYNKRAFYESINNKAPCQCEMTYRLMDLGRTVYPRYVHSGVCKKKSCGVLLRCKPKKYKIRILKRKDFEVDIPLEDHDSLMPESLAEDWISDYVNIVIGCECVPVKV